MPLLVVFAMGLALSAGNESNQFRSLVLIILSRAMPLTVSLLLQAQWKVRS